MADKMSSMSVCPLSAKPIDKELLTRSYANGANFIAEHACIASFMTASIYQPPFLGFVERHPAARAIIVTKSSTVVVA